jgi:hypothetical protein
MVCERHVRGSPRLSPIMENRILNRMSVSTINSTLVDRRVEVFADPVQTPLGADYSVMFEVGEMESVTMVLDGVEIGAIPVRDLLPKA